MPKVTVCIPVYNVEQYIGRCLESVLNQSFQDIEVIVVNDCTPDGSMSVVDKYARRYARIRVINHDRNLGLMWARRTGYLAATGDYITFCDSDDTLPVDAIKKLYECAIESNADIVSGNIRFIKTNGEEEIWRNSLNYGSDAKGIYESMLKLESRHNLCSKLFKRELLHNNEYQTFEHFTNGEDACLFYQVVKNSSSMFQLEDVVYDYYQNLDSSSQTRLSDSQVRNVIEANIQNYNICVKYPELKQLTKRAFSMNINNWYIRGYNSDGLIDYILRENNMQFLSNPLCMISFLPPALCLKIIIKRFLLHWILLGKYV